jgi:hypothetical protein
MENEEKKERRKRSKQPIKKGEAAPDPNYAQKSRVWQKLFSQRRAAFEAIDPALDFTFEQDWLKTIELFEAHPSDETLVDLQEQTTLDLAAYHKSLLKPVDELEYFVKKTFPDNARILMEFAFDKIRSAVNSANLHTTLLCATTFTIYEDYETQLLAAGLPANWAADFNALLGAANSFLIPHERAKRLRIRATTQRVELYNQLYGFWKKVNRAAPLVYPDNPVEVGLWARR